MRHVAVVLDSAGTLVRAHRVIRCVPSGRMLTSVASTEIASRGMCALVSLACDPLELPHQGALCELVPDAVPVYISCAPHGMGERDVLEALRYERQRTSSGERCATTDDLLHARRMLTELHGPMDYITSGLLVDLVGKRIAGVVCAGGVLEREAVEAVEQLRTMAELHICSGDAPYVVQKIARRLGVPPSNTAAHCTPRCKASYVSRLREHYLVVMVGDGMNDVLAVRAADLGVAFGAYGTISERLMEAADVVVRSHAELVEVVRSFHSSL